MAQVVISHSKSNPISQALADSLKKSGFTVVIAENPVEFFKIVTTSPCHLGCISSNNSNINLANLMWEKSPGHRLPLLLLIEKGEVGNFKPVFSRGVIDYIAPATPLVEAEKVVKRIIHPLEDAAVYEILEKSHIADNSLFKKNKKLIEVYDSYQVIQDEISYVVLAKKEIAPAKLKDTPLTDIEEQVLIMVKPNHLWYQIWPRKKPTCVPQEAPSWARHLG